MGANDHYPLKQQSKKSSQQQADDGDVIDSSPGFKKKITATFASSKLGGLSISPTKMALRGKKEAPVGRSLPRRETPTKKRKETSEERRVRKEKQKR